MKSNFPFAVACMIGCLLFYMLHEAEDKLASRDVNLAVLSTVNQCQGVEITKLQTQISELKTDKQKSLEVLLSYQVNKDKLGFDYPNALLPPLPVP